MTRDEMIKAVCKINGTNKFTPEEEGSMLFLLAAANRGTLSGDRLAHITGLSREKCREYARQARRQGIFKDGNIYANGWFDEETGSIGFICDAMCISGMMERAQDAA